MCIVSVVIKTCSCQLNCGLRARMYVGGGRPPGNPKMAVPLHQINKFIRIVSYSCRGLTSSTQKLHHRPYVVNIMKEQYVDIINVYKKRGLVSNN